MAARADRQADRRRQILDAAVKVFARSGFHGARVGDIAEEAGVAAQFVEGSVTALREAGVGTGYRLVLDVECFNLLNDEERAAVGRESRRRCGARCGDHSAGVVASAPGAAPSWCDAR